MRAAAIIIALLIFSSLLALEGNVLSGEIQGTKTNNNTINNAFSADRPILMKPRATTNNINELLGRYISTKETIQNPTFTVEHDSGAAGMYKNGVEVSSATPVFTLVASGGNILGEPVTGMIVVEATINIAGNVTIIIEYNITESNSGTLKLEVIGSTTHIKTISSAGYGKAILAVRSSGTGTITIRLNATAPGTASSTVTNRITADILSVVAENNPPPAPTIISPNNNTQQYTPELTVTWTAVFASDFDHYEISNDGGNTWIDVGTKTNYTFILNNGTYTILVRSVDVAGNTNTSKPILVHILNENFLQIQSTDSYSYYWLSYTRHIKTITYYSGYIFVGGYATYDPSEFYLAKFRNDTFAMVWQKTWGQNTSDSIDDMISFAGYIYAVGTEDNADGFRNDVVVLCLDIDGNVLWETKIITSTYSGDSRGVGITTDGSYLYVVGADEDNNYFFVSKLSLSGNIILTRELSGGLLGGDILYHNKKLYVVGDKLYMIETQDLTILTTINYGYPLKEIVRLDDELLIASDNVLLKIDTQGNIIWTKTFEWKISSITVDKLGNIYLTTYHLDNKASYERLNARFTRLQENITRSTIQTVVASIHVLGGGVGFLGAQIIAMDPLSNATAKIFALYSYVAGIYKYLKVYHITAIADIEEPQITITAPTNQSITNKDVTVSWTATDNYGIDHYEIYLDGNLVATTASASYTLTGLSEGQRTIEVKAIDKAGNVATDSITINVDTTPPNFTSWSPANNSYHNTTNITVSWVAIDNYGIDHYEIYVDGNLEGTTTSTNYPLTLTENQHTIKIVAVDKAGNTAQITLVIHIDTTKPTLGNAEWVNSFWNPYNESSVESQYTLIQEGDWITDQSHQGVTIRIQLDDNYGISTVTVALYEVDTGKYRNDAIVGYKYYVDVKYLYVWLDTRNLIDGATYRLEVTATDLAGNTPPTHSYTFKLDNAQPQLQNLDYMYEYGYYYQSVYYYGGNYKIMNITAIITDYGDNLVYINVSLKSPDQELWIIEFTWSGVEWSYNALIQGVISVCVDGNQSWVRISIRVNITSIAEGNYEAKIYAKDDAGYWNAWSNNVKIDWTPPRNLRIWLESYDVDNPSSWTGNYSIICGQWYIYYSVEDYYDYEINMIENMTGTSAPLGTNGSFFDTTANSIRNGIFIITLRAWDEVGNKAIVRYIIAVVNNVNYPYLYINGTRVIGDTADAGGLLNILVAIDIADNAILGHGWPSGLKWFIIYLDGEVLYNVTFGDPNDPWDRYYAEWYNISFTLDEAQLSPGAHIIRIETGAMGEWADTGAEYIINYKPRVKIELLNSSVYWGYVDLYFNVTDLVGRPLNGRLNITIAGELYSLSVTGGSAVLSYVYLAPDIYTLDVAYYQGEGLDTNASFVLEVLKHPLAYSNALSQFAVNRSYSINLTNILDALDNMQPTGILWFEVYWSYTQSGPWMLLYNVSYEGSAIILRGAWTIDDLNGDGIIDDADGTLYIRIVVGGWYEADDIVVQRALLRGDYTISISETQFYWGDITLTITVDDTVSLDEDNYALVNLAGTVYTVDIVGGSGTLSIYIDDPGTYSLTITYVGDVVNATKTFTLEVLKHPVVFDINYPAVLYVNGYYELQLYDIIDTAIGNVPSDIFTVNVTYTWELPAPRWFVLDYVTIGGSAYTYSGTWSIADLNGDGLINDADYYVYIRFTVIGNKYEGEKVIGPITVKQIPEISMTQQSDILVYTDYGEFLVDTNVPQAFIRVYYWDNVEGWVWNGTYTTDSQGNAIVRIYVPDIGTVKYKVAINETEHYQAYEKTFEFNAVAESTSIHILSVGTWRYSDQAVVTVYLEDDDGAPSRGVEIELRIYENGSWITVGQATTNATGYATVITTCWLGEGKYNLTVLIIDDKYVGDAASVMISVLKEKVTKVDAKVEAGQLIVSVIDDENTSLPRIPVEIVFNGSVIADSVTNDQGNAIFNVAGYEGRELVVRIKDNPYSETKETKIVVPQNAVSTLNQNRWIVVVFALVLAGIAIAYYYRRGEGYAFDESLSFGMDGENIITLERRNGSNTIVSKENLEEEL